MGANINLPMHRDYTKNDILLGIGSWATSYDPGKSRKPTKASKHKNENPNTSKSQTAKRDPPSSPLTRYVHDKNEDPWNAVASEAKRKMDDRT